MQTTLIAFMAARPLLFRDWPNAGEWLGMAVAAVDVELLRAELDGRPRAARVRAAHLLHLGRQGRHHSNLFDVIDSTGVEVRAQ